VNPMYLGGTMTDVSFTVDPDGLERLRGRLSSIESGMQGAGDLTGSYQALGLGSGRRVLEALTTFHDEWSGWMATVRQNLDTLQQLLGQAASGYLAVDGKVAGSAGTQAATFQSAPPQAGGT
jgi:hypothetical protein